MRRRATPVLATAFLLGALAVGAATPAGGIELWRRGDHHLDLGGSLRQIVRHGKGTDGERFERAAAAAGPACVRAATFPDCPAWDVAGESRLTDGLTRLRLHLDAVWSRALSATVVWDNEARYGDLGAFPAGADEPPDTFFGWESGIRAFGLSDEGDRVRWTSSIYRGYVRFDGDRVGATLGRQRVSWGVGRLWNPTDRFGFVPPLAIEGDQIPGVDGVELRWRFSGFDHLQAVYAPGTRSADARYALRYQGVVRDVDVSLLAGVFEEARVVGFDGAANAWGAALRLEAAWTDPGRPVWPVGAAAPAEPDPFWQVVVSADTHVDVGSGLYVLVETLYNGNALGFGAGRAGPRLAFFEASAAPGRSLPPSAAALGGPFAVPASRDVFASSLVVSLARVQTGVQLGYEPTPAWRSDLVAIVDWEGGSAAFFPTFTFTGFDVAELTLGAQLFAGGPRSEYGWRPALVYLLAEVFW